MLRRVTSLLPLSIALLAGEAAAAPRDAEDVALGPDHGCVVTSCGEVTCWGRDDWGQSADRSPTVGPVLQGTPTVPRFEAVSVGQYHTCALDEYGHADCWGKNNYGQSADRNGPFRDLDAGWNHNCGIWKNSGTIQCWGSNSQGAVNDKPMGAFESISSGLDFSCAIEAGGKGLSCWGANAYGQAPVWIEPPNSVAGEVFTAVSAGAYHACAVTDWGSAEALYCWGYEPYASLGGYALELDEGFYWLPYWDVLQVDAGSAGTMASRLISGDPEVFGYGWPFATYPVPAGTKADDFALGSNHWCTVDDLGDLACTGNNGYGKATPPSMTGQCPSPFGFPGPLFP